MTDDQIKSIIQYAISEWGPRDADQGVAVALEDIAKGQGNVRGMAQALFLIGESLESIAKTYKDEVFFKYDGEI